MRTSVARRVRTRLWMLALAAVLPGAMAVPSTDDLNLVVREPALDKHFRLGAVQFSPCRLGRVVAGGATPEAAQCGHVDVPENWSDPRGHHISLRVAVVPSLAKVPAADAVAFLDGGPGGAASEDYPLVAAAFEPLRAHHHIVLMDQRGTGGSNPLLCPHDELAAAKDAPRAGAARAGAPRAGHEAEAGVAVGAHDPAFVRLERCLEHLAPRAAPALYTTSATVLDLEAVRSALGVHRLDLVAVSYGTRVAQHYATRYPEAVRTVVLDSAVPNRLPLLSENERNLEDALRQRAAACREDASCVEHHGDPWANARRLAALLKIEPQTVVVHDGDTFATHPRRLGIEEFTGLLRYYLYSSTTSALLPSVLHDATEGRYAPLLEHAHSIGDDLARDRSEGLAASVLCAEDMDEGAAAGAGAARPLFGRAAESAVALACRIWPHGSAPPGFRAPFRSSLPVLLLAGEFDPVTPPRYAREIAEGLAHGRVIVAPGEGHAVLGTGCLPRLMAHFVDAAADPKALDARCLAPAHHAN